MLGVGLSTLPLGLAAMTGSLAFARRRRPAFVPVVLVAVAPLIVVQAWGWYAWDSVNLSEHAWPAGFALILLVLGATLEAASGPDKQPSAG